MVGDFKEHAINNNNRCTTSWNIDYNYPIVMQIPFEKHTGAVGLEIDHRGMNYEVSNYNQNMGRWNIGIC